jgi:hypothetical protein
MIQKYNENSNRKIRSFIDDYLFWQNLNELLELIKSIHKFQIESERTDSYLDKIISR